jgi:sodium-dependent phosphate cotransporter
MGCALGHLFFNCYGTAVFWPLQFIPISLAKGFAKIAMRRRLLAAGYVLSAFFVVPIIVIILIRWMQG